MLTNNRMGKQIESVFRCSGTVEWEYAAGYTMTQGTLKAITGVVTGAQILNCPGGRGRRIIWCLLVWSQPGQDSEILTQSWTHKQMARINRINKNSNSRNTCYNFCLKKNQRNKRKFCSSGDIWLQRETKKKSVGGRKEGREAMCFLAMLTALV